MNTSWANEFGLDDKHPYPSPPPLEKVSSLFIGLLNVHTSPKRRERNRELIMVNFQFLNQWKCELWNPPTLDHIKKIQVAFYGDLSTKNSLKNMRIKSNLKTIVEFLIFFYFSSSNIKPKLFILFLWLFRPKQLI